RGRCAAVGIALAQHRVDRRALDPVVAGLDVLFLLVLRRVRVVRQRVALRLQFLDRRLQLRHRGGDVRQLDDVGFRALGQLAQLGQVVADLLVLAQVVRELRQDAAGQRDVPGFDLDAGGGGEGLDDGQQRLGGQERRFVGQGIDDLRRVRHGLRGLSGADGGTEQEAPGRPRRRQDPAAKPRHCRVFCPPMRASRGARPCPAVRSGPPRAAAGPRRTSNCAMNTPYPTVRLKNAWRSSHPWIFQKLVEKPAQRPRPGEIVDAYDVDGQFIGRGFYNGHSRIALRILETDPAVAVDADWFARRIGQAVALRREVLKLDEVSNAWRVVHAEGDGLTGLVVDRYDDLLVVEFFSAGMWRYREWIYAALQAQFPGARIYSFAEDHVQKQESFDYRPVYSGGGSPEPA